MAYTDLRDQIDPEPRRPLPRNVEVEQKLLGGILFDSSLYRGIANIVSPEDFSLAVHARIFEAIGNLIESGSNANPAAALAHLFNGDAALRTLGGGQYLSELAKSVPTLSAVPDYAKLVSDLALRRELITDLYDPKAGQTVSGILEDHRERLSRIAIGAGLAGINPRALKDLPVPERRFIVTPWIPMRRATGLYGSGGIGKTTLMQMLCTSAALDPAKFSNANWLGLPVLHCRSVLLFCEDDLDEMHARQEEINRAYGCSFDDLGDMLWLPRLGEDNTLIAFENGKACRTAFFYELLDVTNSHGARLAVWDTLTDVFGGSEIDRGQARRFVQEGPSYMAREIDGSVIACAHPSVAGIKNGTGSSGSTGWDGAFRSRLYLSSPKDDENEEVANTNERILTRVKANWAKIGETIPMQWRDGVFLADRPAGGIVGSIEKRTCERVFMDLFDTAESLKQPLSSNISARNYAPRLFGRLPKTQREGFGTREFDEAMRRLIGREIHNEKYGRKGDERWRLSRLPQPMG
jgi:RecA-family ATPase